MSTIVLPKRELTTIGFACIPVPVAVMNFSTRLLAHTNFVPFVLGRMTSFNSHFLDLREALMPAHWSMANEAMRKPRSPNLGSPSTHVPPKVRRAIPPGERWILVVIDI